MNPESEYHRQAAAEKAVSTANKDDPATAELLSRVKELDTEVASLRKQQEDTHKVMARLKAVFKERTAVFREAIFRLFGYRCEHTSEHTYKCISTHTYTACRMQMQWAWAMLPLCLVL